MTTCMQKAFTYGKINCFYTMLANRKIADMKMIHTYKAHDKIGITMFPIQYSWGRHRYLFGFDLSFFGNNPPFKPKKSRYYLSIDLFWHEFDFRIGEQGSWMPCIRWEQFNWWRIKRRQNKLFERGELF